MSYKKPLIEELNPRNSTEERSTFLSYSPLVAGGFFGGIIGAGVGSLLGYPVIGGVAGAVAGTYGFSFLSCVSSDPDDES